MNYHESISIGLKGLVAHKLRAILTALGIIFGVAAVISMMSIGEGAKQEALEQIQLLGMNNIIVNDVPIDDPEKGKGRSNLSKGLTLQDAYSIEKVNPLVDLVVPQISIESEVRYGQEKQETTIIGTTPDFEKSMTFYPQKGAFMNYLDVKEARRVCILGSAVKSDLFFFHDAVGQAVKMGQQWYTVIGVMEKKPVGGGAGGATANLNRNVYIPITSAIKRFSRLPFESEIDRIIIKVQNADKIQEAANIVNDTMKRRHNDVQDFSITIPEALLKQQQQTQRIFNIVMGAIAGISLLVGGIGIMNIMLASVLERTREIGIRRAIGAQRSDILGQFLVEAVVLSFVGGLIGVFLGFGMTKAISLYAGWRTIVSVPAIFLAFGVSAAVGIIFGLYPARQASMLDPIESLRYE